jgi:beta-lactam-binding protein with PASTA domain
VVSEDASPGTVVEQRPAATTGGSTGASEDGAVDVLVTLGGPSVSYLMPDLVYRNVDEVRRFFDTHGFRLNEVRSEPYEGIPEGVILRQSPPAGHPVSRHDAISLVVASRLRP